MSTQGEHVGNAAVETGLCPVGRLWQRAPVHDPSGAPSNDFLLWVPGLAQAGDLYQAHLKQALLGVCQRFEAQVLLVDINVQRGTIWFSVLGVPGLAAQIAQTVRAEVPQVRLVGMPLESIQRGLRLAWWQRVGLRVSHIRRHVWRRLLPSQPDNAAR